MGLFTRAVSLAVVPVKSSARIAGAATAGVLGADKDKAYAKATEYSVRTLTEALAKARGPAMKFGQVLALFSSSLPPDQAEMLESLTKLYEDATPRPYSQIRPILDKVLPEGVSVEETAVAAASLGQVHKGVWNDGREVAIKVLYPDAHKIVRADILQLRTFVPLIHRILPTLDVKALLQEHEEKLWHELDYYKEARWQQEFKAAWDTHYPGIVTIPEVLFGTENVLVTEWIEGTPYRLLADTSVEDRRTAGKALARFILWSPQIVGATHADPHPGNYRLLPDGTLGVLDFGSVASPAGVFSSLFADTFKACAADDDLLLETLWLEAGFIPHTTTAEELKGILDIDLTPYLEQEFTFRKEWLMRRAGEWSDPRSSLQDVSKLSFPPEVLLEHRAVSGMLALLTSVEATVDFKAVIDNIESRV